MDDLRAAFEDQGYVIMPDALDLDRLASFEAHVAELVRRALRGASPEVPPASTLDALRVLTREDRPAFHKICRSAGTSLAGLRLAAAGRLPRVVEALHDHDAAGLYPSSPAIFWNDPEAEELQYDWHQESSYYPGRAVSFHVWFPLFRDLSVNDGPMVVCRGSHREAFPFERAPVPGGLTQLRVDDAIADRFDQLPCALPRGAAILFHPNLLHKTLPNRSELPRTSGIIRYFALMHDAEYAPVLGPVCKA